MGPWDGDSGKRALNGNRKYERKPYPGIVPVSSMETAEHVTFPKMKRPSSDGTVPFGKLAHVHAANREARRAHRNAILVHSPRIEGHTKGDRYESFGKRPLSGRRIDVPPSAAFSSRRKATKSAPSSLFGNFVDNLG